MHIARTDLLLILTFAWHSNTNTLVHKSPSRWLDDFNLHSTQFWEILDPTNRYAAWCNEPEVKL